MNLPEVTKFFAVISRRARVAVEKRICIQFPRNTGFGTVRVLFGKEIADEDVLWRSFEIPVLLKTRQYSLIGSGLSKGIEIFLRLEKIISRVYSFKRLKKRIKG